MMMQTWREVLFAHWPVDYDLLRSLVPAKLALDLFNGMPWISVVPFRMRNVAPRGVPSLPGISSFPELNVRTYVRVDDRPGVYFFSLDAGSAVAVRAARLLLNLPYFSASMTMTSRANAIAYTSRRANHSGAELMASYEPTGAIFHPREGSLEYFLTERYCLYNRNRRGRPYRLHIHHPRWTLQCANAEFTRNTMA